MWSQCVGGVDSGRLLATPKRQPGQGRGGVRHARRWPGSRWVGLGSGALASWSLQGWTVPLTWGFGMGLCGLFFAQEAYRKVAVLTKAWKVFFGGRVREYLKENFLFGCFSLSPKGLASPCPGGPACLPSLPALFHTSILFGKKGSSEYGDEKLWNARRGIL